MIVFIMVNIEVDINAKQAIFITMILMTFFLFFHEIDNFIWAC